MIRSEFKITMSAMDDLKEMISKENHTFLFEEDDIHECTLTEALELCLKALKCYGYHFDEDKLVEIIQDDIDFETL